LVLIPCSVIFGNPALRDISLKGDRKESTNPSRTVKNSQEKILIVVHA
jgi:hypothetical protein